MAKQPNKQGFRMDNDPAPGMNDKGELNTISSSDPRLKMSPEQRTGGGASE